VKNFIAVIATAGVATAGAANLPSPVELKAPKNYPGPYVAYVIKNTDSDTHKLAIHVWPDHIIKVGLRVNGIDTPEKFRPKCDREKMLARDASNFVAGLIPPGTQVQVTNVKLGKYAGRAVGTINYGSATGTDTIAKALIRRQHAVRYDGGTKTKDWCAE